MITVYTDGAYASSRDQGGWAFVFLEDNEKIYSDYGTDTSTTNNRMELKGAIEAIKYANAQEIKEYTIYTDSMYIVGTMTKNWNKKKNVDLWLQLDEVIKKDSKIEWKHIKGHSGDKWNNYVDMLAVHGSQLIIN